MAQPTIGSIVLRVRAQLQDTQTPNRYSDAMIAAHVFDALMLIHDAHPETRYRGLELANADYPVVTASSSAADVSAALALELPVDPSWDSAIQHYCVAKSLEMYTSDSSNDARVQYHMGMFNSRMK